MSVSVYYNEIDPYCCQWLQNLMDAGHLPYGWIDSRPIQEVHPDELEAFTQCHFFAGIGGWPLALQMAGWGDEPVWTGSCPCQPFSVAGKRGGVEDERHLWPYWCNLIDQFRPPIVFGEQVASPDSKKWLSGVRFDFEIRNYRFGSANLCGPFATAPHLRSRYFFVADASNKRPFSAAQAGIHNGETGTGARNVESERLRISPALANTASEQMGTGGQSRICAANSFMANSNGYHEHWWSGPLQVGWNAIEGTVERRGRKYRAQWRVKPGISIVANGIPARVDKLRAIGNAIIPQVAAEFIQAYIELRLAVTEIGTAV